MTHGRLAASPSVPRPSFVTTTCHWSRQRCGPCNGMSGILGRDRGSEAVLITARRKVGWFTCQVPQPGGPLHCPHSPALAPSIVPPSLPATLSHLQLPQPGGPTDPFLEKLRGLKGMEVGSGVGSVPVIGAEWLIGCLPLLPDSGMGSVRSQRWEAGVGSAL